VSANKGRSRIARVQNLISEKETLRRAGDAESRVGKSQCGLRVVRNTKKCPNSWGPVVRPGSKGKHKGLGGGTLRGLENHGLGGEKKNGVRLRVNSK